MYTPQQRKANNALGICVICLVMLMESSFAHLKRPSPLSPWVWGVLGLGAVASLAYYLRHRGRPTANVPGAPPRADRR